MKIRLNDLDLGKTELTMNECRDLLGVSNSRISQLIKSGDLEPVYHKGKKYGRVRNITVTSMSKYLAKLMKYEGVN